MNSTTLKCIVIGFVIFALQCSTEDVSTNTLHQIMSLKLELLNDTSSQIYISTSAAGQHTLYKVNDTCMITYTRHQQSSSGGDSVFTVLVPNDSALLNSGRFSGLWAVPNSVDSICRGSREMGVPADSIRIYACLKDETNHDVCSYMVLDSTIYPKKK
jgi:hypothetical protein